MPAPRACPVVRCRGVVVGSLVIACLPAGGPGVNRWIASCPSCWRRAQCARVHVEFEPDDRGRRHPRVTIDV